MGDGSRGSSGLGLGLGLLGLGLAGGMVIAAGKVEGALDRGSKRLSRPLGTLAAAHERFSHAAELISSNSNDLLHEIGTEPWPKRLWPFRRCKPRTPRSGDRPAPAPRCDARPRRRLTAILKLRA